MPELKKSPILLLLLLLSACTSVPIQTQPAAVFQEGEEFYGAKRYEDAIAQYKKVRDVWAGGTVRRGGC